MLANVAPLVLLAAAAAAQSTLCVPGQCLQGSSNISIGAVVTGKDQLVLLPGVYSSTSDPESLRVALTQTSSRMSFSPGFAPNTTGTNAGGSIIFPLNVALQPGMLATTASLYRGQTQFHALPTTNDGANSTVAPQQQQSTISGAGSIVMSDNVWASFTSGASRLVLWDSVADLAQLPSTSGNAQLTLVDLQSSACSPACSGSGICTSAGTCVCPPGGGFNGTSCESCTDGFFGPQCLACPEDCEVCDDGATGSGKCLVPKVEGAPSTCNCVNGLCAADGSCECNQGWQDASNGAKCSACADGFFQSEDGNCEVCQNGCLRCQSGTGVCSQCGTGMKVDGNDNTKCVVDNGANTKLCPAGTFANGDSCLICSPSCSTCTGSGASACLACSQNTFKLDGQCVPVSSEGVCSGSQRVANVNKGTCDACSAGCAECSIQGFTLATTFDQVQCTKCLPGSVLADGKCVSTCPDGTLNNGAACVTCDASCATCAGDSKFCLTCAGTSLASNGICGATCPSGTFQSNGACLPCHGDCATCSGAGFDQCTTCTDARPVLQAASGNAATGRCLPTCPNKNQYFDAASSKCLACDGSCSSCSGAGPSQCLACANRGQVLSGGLCVDAKCERGSAVVAGLGVCLSTLVAAPFVDNTPVGGFPAPITPIKPSGGGGKRLAWWEILLMALGCAFIFVLFLVCWRRRMRKKRAAQTAAFAQKVHGRPGFWSRGAHWLGDKLFHTRVGSRDNNDVDAMIGRMRKAETERHKHEMEMLETRARSGGAQHGKWDWMSAPARPQSFLSVSDAQQYKQRYQDRSRAPSPQPSISGSSNSRRYDDAGSQHHHIHLHQGQMNRLSTPSLYSVMTGVPRRGGPEPRQPLRDTDALVDVPLAANISPASRFSTSTTGTSFWRVPYAPMHPEPPMPAPAPVAAHRTGESFESYHSHASSAESLERLNRNPFRR